MDMLVLLMVMQLALYVGIMDGNQVRIVIQFMVVLFYVKHKLGINAFNKIILV